MSISEEQEILLSQLVDGELPVDQANQVLADVFDELTHVLGNAEAGGKLNAMLQLRRALHPWRQQEPPKTIVALPSANDELPSPSGRGAGGEGHRGTGGQGPGVRGGGACRELPSPSGRGAGGEGCGGPTGHATQPSP